MPYIPKDRRDDLTYGEEPPKNAGELNYIFTEYIRMYLSDKRLSYQTINDVVGALECAKLELYRRIAVPYEEEKKDTNGDVYE